MDEQKTAIISVVVLPRNQFHFQYRLNEGKMHTIKKEDALGYLSQFVSSSHYLKLTNLLSKFLPFIILVPENEIVELKKEDSDPEHYRKGIEDELQTIGKYYRNNFDQEKFPNDKKIKEISKKFLNF